MRQASSFGLHVECESGAHLITLCAPLGHGSKAYRRPHRVEWKIQFPEPISFRAHREAKSPQGRKLTFYPSIFLRHHLSYTLSEILHM